MKQVLVTTDFSENSKAGIRFAIQWASQQRLSLIFVHVLHVLRPTKWPDEYFESYAAEEVAEFEAKLPIFVHDIYQLHGIEPGQHSFLILQGNSADVTIRDYCNDNAGIDYICMATSGAGKLEKFFGTNAGNLITTSDVPVIAVPASYKMAPIKKLVYATDMKRYKQEIKKVAMFAEPLKCRVDAVHFTWPNESSLDKVAIDKEIKKQLGVESAFHFEQNDGVHTLVQNLQEQVKKLQPSVMVMFTNQKRNLFQKIFLSSKAEEYAFKTTVPLLVFSQGN